MSQARVTRALVYFAKFKTLVDKQNLFKLNHLVLLSSHKQPHGSQAAQAEEELRGKREGNTCLLGRFCVVNAGNFGCDM